MNFQENFQENLPNNICNAIGVKVNNGISSLIYLKTAKIALLAISSLRGLPPSSPTGVLSMFFRRIFGTIVSTSPKVASPNSLNTFLGTMD